MTDELAPPPSIKVSWVIGILAVFLLFLLIATYSSRMANTARTYEQIRNEQRLQILHKQQAADQEALTTPMWIDQAKGTVRIPIDEAMPQTVTALKTKQPHMGLPLPSSAPAAAPAAPAAGAPSTNAPTGSAPAAEAKPKAGFAAHPKPSEQGTKK